MSDNAVPSVPTVLPRKIGVNCNWHFVIIIGPNSISFFLLLCSLFLILLFLFMSVSHNISSCTYEMNFFWSGHAVFNSETSRRQSYWLLLGWMFDESRRTGWRWRWLDGAWLWRRVERFIVPGGCLAPSLSSTNKSPVVDLAWRHRAHRRTVGLTGLAISDALQQWLVSSHASRCLGRVDRAMSSCMSVCHCVDKVLGWYVTLNWQDRLRDVLSTSCE